MSQQYETITTLQPVNANREPIVVHLCRGCGALVGHMGLHDAHHAWIKTVADVAHETPSR